MHKARGFTIVELLIVIVVIGILAAIVIVAYNGIQTSAKNTKTVTAVTAWAKALRAYNLENKGNWPTSTSCLGNSTTYASDGKCWQNGTFTVTSSFLSDMQKYVNGQPPEPDLTYVTSPTMPIRGGRYDYGTTPSIYYVLSKVSECPQIPGINQTYKSVYSDGVQCGGALIAMG